MPTFLALQFSLVEPFLWVLTDLARKAPKIRCSKRATKSHLWVGGLEISPAGAVFDATQPLGNSDRRPKPPWAK
uniref:Secreted protein n=1 Tax=Bursaphelenchus xylophilus TaxID=6326 RepID=A0A1I7RT87_BURXY